VEVEYGEAIAVHDRADINKISFDVKAALDKIPGQGAV
jgi:hypothetical protein